MPGGRSEAKAIVYERADFLCSVIGNHPFGNLATRRGDETALGPWFCVPASRRVCPVEDEERDRQPRQPRPRLEYQLAWLHVLLLLNTKSLSRDSSRAVNSNQRRSGPRKGQVNPGVFASRRAL